MPSAFSFKNVVKRFPGFQLGPLDFELQPGIVLGYVGPNGSGKTTTMQCLVGLLRVDEGEMEVFGRRNDPNRPEWKLDIGYVGDVHVFYENWSGEKNLRFRSRQTRTRPGESVCSSSIQEGQRAIERESRQVVVDRRPGARAETAASRRTDCRP
jgi:ABC-type multidrug transport system ATPase subunit